MQKKHSFIPLNQSNILIYYDDIVKSGDLFIIKTILNNYYDKFKDYMYLEDFKNTENEFLIRYLCSRTIQNPFEWLKIKDFNTEKNYKYFKNKYQNMYIESNGFDIQQDIIKYIGHFAVKNVIFFSKEYDKRIDFDIQYTYKDDKNYNKITYATGSLENLIDKFEPEIIFYPYIESIIPYVRKYRDIVFAIPSYGFNIDSEMKPKGMDITKDTNIGLYPIIRNNKPVYFG